MFRASVAVEIKSTKHRSGIEESGSLDTQLIRLPELRRGELDQLWRRLFGCEPPRRIGRSIMLRALAYRLQAKAQGGLNFTTRRLLERLGAEAVNANAPITAARRQPSTSGTVFVRQWRGVIHQVTVGDDGVRYRGGTYRSLSEVARLITGARWSGPAFFGLKSQAKVSGSGGGD